MFSCLSFIKMWLNCIISGYFRTKQHNIVTKWAHRLKSHWSVILVVYKRQNGVYVIDRIEYMSDAKQQTGASFEMDIITEHFNKFHGKTAKHERLWQKIRKEMTKSHFETTIEYFEAHFLLSSDNYVHIGCMFSFGYMITSGCMISFHLNW